MVRPLLHSAAQLTVLLYLVQHSAPSHIIDGSIACAAQRNHPPTLDLSLAINYRPQDPFPLLRFVLAKPPLREICNPPSDSRPSLRERAWAMDPTDGIYSLAGLEAPDLAPPDLDDLAMGGPVKQLADGSPSKHLADGSPSKHLADGSPSKHLADGSPSKHLADGSPSKLLADGSPSKLLADGSPSKHLADGSPSKLLADGSPSKHLAFPVGPLAQNSDEEPGWTNVLSKKSKKALYYKKKNIRKKDKQVAFGPVAPVAVIQSHVSDNDSEVIWYPKFSSRRATMKWSMARQGGSVGTPNGMGFFVFGSIGDNGIEY